MSPFAPHISEELWQRLGHKDTIFDAAWPEFNESKTIDESITLILQVNGKLRDKLDVPRGLSRDDLERFARESANVKKHTEGKEIRKVIVVPDKLVNVVVGEQYAVAAKVSVQVTHAVNLGETNDVNEAV